MFFIKYYLEAVLNLINVVNRVKNIRFLSLLFCMSDSSMKTEQPC